MYPLTLKSWGDGVSLPKRYVEGLAVEPPQVNVLAYPLVLKVEGTTSLFSPKRYAEGLAEEPPQVNILVYPLVLKVGGRHFSFCLSNIPRG